LFCAWGLAVVSIACFFESREVVAADQARPSVLLILTDDQGWGDLSVHGNEQIETPVLDQLAAASVQFDRFYVSPVCAPTRAALLTGRYPERTGVAGVTGRREVMAADETTLAEFFKQGGYSTGCFGKWHNGAQMPLHPNGQGFDEFFGFCGGHFNLYDNPLLERNGKPVKTEGYITDLLTDAAIEFVEAQQADEPFFCYVPYNAPHGPFQVHRDLFDKYNTGELDTKTAAVYAMVENIDSNVGRLLDSLNKTGRAENTIVIFLTDNGPNGKRYNGGMRGAKGSVHEGGCRVPCFVRWPAKLKPKQVTQIAGHIDVLPTLARWCGLQLDRTQPLDGLDLSRLASDGQDPKLADRKILTYRPNKAALEKFGRAAVRTQRFRLTIERGKTQLFDMQADPSQTANVADSFPKITKSLRQSIEQYVDQVTPIITAERVVPIGEQRPTFIPSVDASFRGNVAYADGISWAHSWLDHWTSTEDQIRWPVRVASRGRYQVTLHYVCEQANVPLKVDFGSGSMTAKLPRFSSPRVLRPDLDEKAKPRRMLRFRSEPLGIVRVEAGKQLIQLQRLEAGKMIQLGGITITPCDVPADKQRFHLFVLAGQSNMAGRGRVLESDKVPDVGILMLDRNGQWVPAVDPVHFDKSVAGVGLARSFARDYAKQHPDVTVGLIPCAVGGSPVDSWTEGGFHKQTKLYPFDDAKERIEIAAEQGVFKGILWHQGESDSKPGLAEAYKPKLADVLMQLRSLTGGETPILIGGLSKVPESKWTSSRALVDQAHRELADELSDAGFVSSDGLTLKSDNTHFDRESLIQFGKRYAEAWQRISANHSEQ
jgi:arylsulfatase A